MAGNDTVNNSIPAELRKLGGMAPLAETREQAIADSVKNSAGLQQAYPDIDWKESLIKPVINMVFDLQALDPATREKYDAMIQEVMKHLEEPGKAEGFLMQAREALAEYPEVLKQHDAIYMRPDRPVSVVLAQMREAMALKEAMTGKKAEEE